MDPGFRRDSERGNANFSLGLDTCPASALNPSYLLELQPDHRGPSRSARVPRLFLEVSWFLGTQTAELRLNSRSDSSPGERKSQKVVTKLSNFSHAITGFLRISPMFAWLGRLMPREERFFGLFEEHAENLVSGADALRALLDAKASGEESCERLTEIDLQAKRTAAKVMDAVYGTFVTPFDRVDIKHLVRSMDGALDQMRRAARTVTVAGIEDLQPNIQSLGHIAVNCACLVKQAAPLLSDVDKHANE